MDKKSDSKTIRKEIAKFKNWGYEECQNFKGNRHLDHKLGIYIKIIEINDFFDVEIEVSQGEVLSTYSYNLSLWDARHLADIVEGIFKENKIKVYKKRTEWEAARAGEL